MLKRIVNASTLNNVLERIRSLTEYSFYSESFRSRLFEIIYGSFDHLSKSDQKLVWDYLKQHCKQEVSKISSFSETGALEALFIFYYKTYSSGPVNALKDMGVVKHSPTLYFCRFPKGMSGSYFAQILSRDPNLALITEYFKTQNPQNFFTTLDKAKKIEISLDAITSFRYTESIQVHIINKKISIVTNPQNITTLLENMGQAYRREMSIYNEGVLGNIKTSKLLPVILI